MDLRISPTDRRLLHHDQRAPQQRCCAAWLPVAVRRSPHAALAGAATTANGG
jgi:hypothetical protein